jgi:sugar phosphate isomerase/epimerase
VGFDLSRRDALKLLAVAMAAPCRAGVPDAPAKKDMGVCFYSFGRGRFKDATEFLTYCHGIGASGVQVGLGVEPRFAASVGEKAREWGMYVEGQVGMPKSDADAEKFEAELVSAKTAGASVVRGAMLSGRRYETFETLEAFRAFAAESWKALQRAEPILKKQRMKLALENHKDWRVPEMLGMMEKIGSEWVGICIDTGNSISLLEEPDHVVEAYAKWGVSCHIKDMGVKEYEEGFLLSEVPLGKGFLDIRRMMGVLRKANAKIQFSLEMITRDPLKVPCLTKKYWAVMEGVKGEELAATMMMVRKNASKELPSVAGMSGEERAKFEDKNVRESFEFL